MLGTSGSKCPVRAQMEAQPDPRRALPAKARQEIVSAPVFMWLTLAVSGAGPIPQKMQTERPPGIHSTALVGHYIVRASALPMARRTGSRDQKQGHEQCACEPQE